MAEVGLNFMTAIEDHDLFGAKAMWNEMKELSAKLKPKT
jgi:hypothetical protein